MARQRLSRQQCSFWILLCCLLTAIVCHVWLPGIITVSGSRLNNAYPSHSATLTSPVQPILPKGYGVQNSGRDLFAAPREFQLALAAPVAAPAGNNSANNSQPVSRPENQADSKLRLVGVISGGGQAVAIIQKDTGSRSYRINEYIANYQLITVEENSVTLLGPQGNKVLTLER